MHKLSDNPKWTSVSFPTEMLETIKELINELKYWPSVSAFCREAALEKIKKERVLLKELRGNERQARADEFQRLASEDQAETAFRRTRSDKGIDKESQKLKELRTERTKDGDKEQES